MESLPRSPRERRRLLLNETPEQRAARLEAQRLAAEEAERVVHAKRAAARERRLAKKREAHRLRRERERAGIIAKAAKKKAAKKKAVAKSALDRKRERWAKRKAAMASAEAVAERARKAAERAERMEEARLAREVAAANRRMMLIRAFMSTVLVVSMPGLIETVMDRKSPPSMMRAASDGRAQTIQRRGVGVALA